MKENKASIKPQKNGPLIVKNLDKFTNSRNEAIEIKPIMVLCRCGGSKNKPFCDQTHASIGFSDERSETRVPDRKDTYKGRNITIHDNRGICSHAGFCTDNLSSVFRMGKEPWIDPNGADVEDIKLVIKMCPSGALSYTENNLETNDFSNDEEIHIRKNGPYNVRGGIVIENVDLGDGASKEHYTLCRCGHSGNKPRCDGTHWYAAFKDDEGKTISAAARKTEQQAPEWVKVAQTDELMNGQTKKLNLHNQQILLSRVDDKYGAIEGICSHQGGPLIDARIEAKIIRCPWHGHPFDPLSGKSLGNDANLKTYKTDVRSDGIYLEIAAPEKSAWTVSHVLAETFVNWGIKHVFGMVGHSNLGIAEAFRIQEEKGNIKYIGIRHEGAAAFAASAYSKISGKPAICFSIAGPGATNLLTGLWDAHIDRTPVLAITGQINTQFLGPGSFQEINLPAAFQAVAPFSKIVMPDSNHAALASLALKNAIVQRNVSHLIVPDDVQTLDAGTQAPGEPDGRLSDTCIAPAQDAVNLAMYRIWRTRKPAVIVGYGARNSMPEIIEFAEKLRAPVLTTFKAKGQISDSHPLAVGVLGKSGTPLSAHFMNTADLLIVFGSSFSQHTGIDQSKPIIQVDNEQMALAKFHAVENPIWGDAGITARLFIEKLANYSLSTISTEQIAASKAEWKAKKIDMAAKIGTNGVNSRFVINELSRLLPDNAIVALDVGNSTYSFGRYFECKGQRVILSGYLGSIGFAFPAAMGAYFAMPGRQVVSVSGDGGFGQYMTEFNTAVLYNMNITHILLNNNELGKISNEQREDKIPVWQTRLNNPNFADYANNCGGLGIQVTKRADLDHAVRKALAYNGPALVEIITDPLLT
ncbi:MAG: CDGSH iron-sulfur domain-containing protein [Candidatus Syntrophosphaera sp.]|nr:CDGSH iron-sulfur domain-containing protein [Candidatus Syntrophosphaera sp.]